MAKEYVIDIQGQPTRYSDKVRTLPMYFAEPEQGAEGHTGILLLIAGYGGHGMSNVYQKMRKVFADQYDLITVQCDYLGSRYMGHDQHMEITEDMLRKALSPREFHALRRDYAANRHILAEKVLSAYIPLDESADDYNEMGLGQAMDNLMAVKVLMDIIQENGISYNANRVYIYGQSHGAYLGYLCNYLAPGLFTGIIDNSAYLLPYFLNHDRKITKVGENLTLQKCYHYLVSDQDLDSGSYDLRKLYENYQNQAQIIVYHGAEDEMISLEEKQAFLDTLSNVSLHVVTGDMVDGELFHSTGHSLGADLLKLFDVAVCELEKSVTEKSRFVFQNRKFRTERYLYEVDWQSGIPLLHCSDLFKKNEE